MLALGACLASCSDSTGGDAAAVTTDPSDMPSATTPNMPSNLGPAGEGSATTPNPGALPVGPTGPTGATGGGPQTMPPTPPVNTPPGAMPPPVNPPVQPGPSGSMQPSSGGSGGTGMVVPTPGGGGMIQMPQGGSGGTPPAAGGGPVGAGGMSAPEPEPGSDLPPNPSGTAEPGDGGIPRPSGAFTDITVLPWAGFKGAISYSFDDANSSQINNESQLLGLGVPFTWYLQTGKQEAGNAFYQRAYDQGHELGNHTQNHGSGAADQDVTNAQNFIMSTYSIVAYTMAAPNGSTNNYNNITQQLFILDRGVSDALIGPDDNVNMLNLPTWIPPTGAGSQQFNPKVDAAESQGKWQTVCIHGFQGGSDGAYQPISLDGFVDHVEYAKTKNVWIDSMLAVGAYFLGRKAVVAGQVSMQGDSTVYTWTLPDIFPPGQYVRVTVDGGTLSQDGVTLPWNEHGFYEVALDSGSLTVTP